jgi:heme-degrading monooxygenase HmoA
VSRGGADGPVAPGLPEPTGTCLLPAAASVVLLLADVARLRLAWGWSRFALARRSLARCPGLLFAKQLGSGFDAGFGLRPSLTRQGLFLVFADSAQADAFVERSPQVVAYRQRCRELLIARLDPCSSRGSWSGMALTPGPRPPTAGPIAALTRASIRPGAASAFWRRAPATERSLAAARGCRLAAGLGEAPLLRQATFSLWDDAASMDRYARTGAHKEAIRAAGREASFTESMFVRFVPRRVEGRWKGIDYALATHG